MKKLGATMVAVMTTGMLSAAEIQLKGAAEIIREVMAGMEKAKGKTDENKNSVEDFRTAVKAYMQGMDAQAPAVAAEEIGRASCRERV